MFYANKKIAPSANLAQQTAKIIANVKVLEGKELIRLESDTIFVNIGLWTDKTIMSKHSQTDMNIAHDSFITDKNKLYIDEKVALNWIDCLLIYYRVKRSFKNNTLYFKNIETNELIGTCINKKAKVLLIS